MSDSIKLTFFDVGVGDSTGITFTEDGVRRCILVDGGQKRKKSNDISKYLESEQIEAIDLLVASHFDQDHILGLIYLLRDMADGRGPLRGLKVRNYWGPMPLSSTMVRLVEPSGLSQPARFVIQSLKQNEELLKQVKRCISDPQAIRFPSRANPPPLDLFSSFQIELLAPDHQVAAEDVQKAALTLPIRSPVASIKGIGTIDDLRKAVRRLQAASARRADHTANNLSIILRLTPTARAIRKWKILLTGDAEEESWESMEDRGEDLSAGILKVSHHGSTNGTPPWTIARIQPEYSIISVGQRHGHPTETVYRALLQPGNKIFCTEKNIGSRPSGCKAFDCPKSGRPGSISFLLDSNPPHLTVTPDDAFCTETLHGELGPLGSDQ